MDWSESAVLSAIYLRTLLDKAQARTAAFIGITANGWRKKLDEVEKLETGPKRDEWAKEQIEVALMKKKGKAGAEAEVKAFREVCNSSKALEILASSKAPARVWGNKYAHNLPNRAEVEKMVNKATLNREQLSNDEQEGYMKLVAVVFAGAKPN
ncbi:hypothetical protein D9613_006638 [Agrocybe pediades]|uniref:Uncharacterized protein n=1 Tax=Agrocybe pediades TaxID=84607 RepID=A0A8H4QH68_9AGAR|nr:hypothetical protein D9613_006638 [Agrocybe pediades]